MSLKQLHRLNRQRLADGLPVLVVTDYHCRHLGEFDRHVACNCPQKTVPAFECVLHGHCSVQRKPTDKSVRYCEKCDDYEPNPQNGDERESRQ